MTRRERSFNLAAAAFLAGALTLAFPNGAAATPTSIVIHAVAHDAKIIGTHVGGARITVREASTGRLLASGLQLGETGDTKRIMKEPRQRGDALYGTPGAAAFTATIDIDRPTTVVITAEGPVGHPDSLQRASATLVMVPGRNVGGDGVVLELHGFIIDVEAPGQSRVARGKVALRAKITMLCGCPIEPGGLWNADDIAVTTRLLSRRGVVQETTLEYAGTVNTFAGAFASAPHGRYTLEIVASDPGHANAAVVRRKLRID